MSDDLIKRLLQLDSHPESAPRQAADRIEALEVERDALRAAITRAGALACQRASHAFIIDALKETDT